MESSLKQFEEHWELNPGDGAFYGPKVRPAERETLCWTLHEEQNKLVKQNGEKLNIFTFPSYIFFFYPDVDKSIDTLCTSYPYTQKISY